MAAVVYTAMRLLGIGPVGTLVASGRLSERDRLVVADFDNRTSDASLAGSVTEAFRIDLGQSPVVRILSTAEVGDALTRMKRDPETPVTPASPASWPRGRAPRRWSRERSARWARATSCPRGF